ncbi:Single insulin-like growth factor-binding domain protein-1 [Armadillidium nasatum]|uniref:Single insulin-like growth factor-binding domain protein-1 n=1 Tax=Armadillidium nasatum TaxID=96803 RepID=A0A5N5SS31_9CRUS|nr:Single insulin-like growth factor-binding domain protein-1 [Armadillidium nasatum]
MVKPFLGLIFQFHVINIITYGVRNCPSSCPTVDLCNSDSHCPFGSETGYCNCCQRCLKGPGKKCGGPNGIFGNCAEDHYCKTDSGGSQNGNPVGSCTKFFPVFCFAPCDANPCPPPPVCKFGTTKDICGCCDICLPGLNEPCFRDGLCGNGFYCDHSSPSGEGICKIWSFRTFLNKGQGSSGYS